MTTGGPILIADDDANDLFLLRRALQKAGLVAPVAEVHDGKEAIAYLAGEGPYGDRERHPYPALLLLDLKMPLLDGFDVLSWLKGRPAITPLPIIMLTSSNHELDQARARELGASEYRIKPHSFEDLVRLVRQVWDRWLAGE